MFGNITPLHIWPALKNHNSKAWSDIHCNCKRYLGCNYKYKGVIFNKAIFMCFVVPNSKDVNIFH
jgi:hypothetical protein